MQMPHAEEIWPRPRQSTFFWGGSKPPYHRVQPNACHRWRREQASSLPPDRL